MNKVTYAMYFEMNRKTTSKELLEFEKIVKPVDNQCFVENAYDNLFVCHSIIKRKSLPQIRDIVERHFHVKVDSFAKTTFINPSYAEEEEIFI